MTNNDKQELARLLYTSNALPEKDIIKKLEISQQILTTWAKEGLWDNLREVVSITKNEQLRILYRQLVNLNKSIMDGSGFPTDKEANIQKKLTVAISNIENETSIGNTVMVAQEFTTWLLSSDEHLAKTIVLHFDAFIKEKMSFTGIKPRT
jgi:uncharacterized protein YjcR